jgi:ABC-2 type transport system permease protein
MAASVDTPARASERGPDRDELAGSGTRLDRVVRSEWTKMWSVRSTPWSLLALVAAAVGFSALVAWGASTHLAEMSPTERANLDVTHNALAGLAFGQLAIAVLGVLIISSEYSTGGIKPTLTAVPQRMKVLTAKGLVFLSVALVVGIVTAFLSFYIGMIFWDRQGMAAHLGDPGVLRAVIGGGLYLAGSGMFGFALGTLLRHTAGAITTAVGLLFVAPPLLALLPGTWGADLFKYFTANAGERITRVVQIPGQLSPWEGYAVFTAEWLVLMLVGAHLMRRRDA